MSGLSHSVLLGQAPPVFRINLSLPPSERYVALACLYKDQMRSMRGIFDDLITSVSPKIPLKLVHWLAYMCLRRLYTDEETEEIRGISLATDIDLYLLICLNTVLDLLMGCTSGGARTKSASQTTKMLHFRTLDWAMDPLRDLIVQLDFYQNSDPQEVLATSITYVGFVGVLTGVRKDLSVSLNFRPIHDPTHDFAFYSNHILVLLGIRQSVSSLLRECIFSRFSPATRSRKPDLSTLDSIVANMPSIPTTAAYFIFSDGARAVTMEKDHRTAEVRSSSSFIVTTNHDQKPDSVQSEQALTADKRRRHHVGLSLMSSDAQALSDLLEDSTERRDCIQAKWDNKLQKHARIKVVEKVGEAQTTRSSLRLRQKREEERLKHESRQASEPISLDNDDMAVTQRELLSWLTTYPILNESTHYATIMDPSKGKVVWAKRYDPDELELF
ncbi:beta subunit of N-acylethanolamine-hydrolyzing acid amidase-domain-containing protein [Talaromyces proteolyticus]|uniref:ceramidase n=1 Tax=Talaromyces proteolyticus TaxID=1131652 RepID=A0AAD4KHJ3_9EURO|nr:beta subunit of N-acylethanolamine-hydrolyzing acid amidase-domain-containing protein [Talaromyces proteolyticus]KAH8692299.1 beta subunit of N-acylethanolamine-hydrolyzing acid amidase-domain-containing protein [Talaromyces proteolyticus]